MRKFAFIPLLMAAGLIISAVLFGGASLLVFFDIPSLIICAVVPFFLLLINFNFNEIVRAFRCSDDRFTTDVNEIKKALVLFKCLEKQIFLMGGIGTFLGLIAMLANIDSMEMVGRGLALALITIFYSLLFNAFLVTPKQTGLKQRLIDAEKN